MWLECPFLLCKSKISAHPLRFTSFAFFCLFLSLTGSKAQPTFSSSVKLIICKTDHIVFMYMSIHASKNPLNLWAATFVGISSTYHSSWQIEYLKHVYSLKLKTILGGNIFFIFIFNCLNLKTFPMLGEHSTLRIYTRKRVSFSFIEVEIDLFSQFTLASKYELWSQDPPIWHPLWSSKEEEIMEIALWEPWVIQDLVLKAAVAMVPAKAKYSLPFQHCWDYSVMWFGILL